jgi:ABC-2 type transport system ATP-binding protein
VTAAVVVDGLVKRYRPQAPPVVDELSFTVREGEVFGLLGPNGAGKSTTVGMLTTRVRPTAGECLIFGTNVVARPAAARRMLAVVPQRRNLDRALDVRQNLLFHARYHGVGRGERNRRADELLERMGLTHQATNKVDWLSGGQAQRVVVARALMHAPRLLFLDEPSTGLDPQSRLFLHERIRDLRADGVTVVLTTHDMEEAEQLSDRVGIVDNGRLLALDTPAALTRSIPAETTISVQARGDHLRAEKVLAALVALSGADAASQDGMTFRVRAGGNTSALLPDVVSVITAHGGEVADVSLARPSLQDVFISLTGRELR